MTDPYNNQKKDNVVEFKRDGRTIEHVDSSTIVERLEMTDELKQLFEDQGIEINED